MAVIQSKPFALVSHAQANKPVYTESSNDFLCFDNETRYKEFINELQGNVSHERQKQLMRTKKLIKKYSHLLNDFDYKN